MTTHRTYKCNLCRDSIEPTEFWKPGFGIFFSAGEVPVFKRVGEVENHICSVCAQGIHDEIRKVIPAKDAT